MLMGAFVRTSLTKNNMNDLICKYCKHETTDAERICGRCRLISTLNGYVGSRQAKDMVDSYYDDPMKADRMEYLDTRV